MLSVAGQEQVSLRALQSLQRCNACIVISESRGVRRPAATCFYIVPTRQCDVTSTLRASTLLGDKDGMPASARRAAAAARAGAEREAS